MGGLQAVLTWRWVRLRASLPLLWTSKLIIALAVAGLGSTSTSGIVLSSGVMTSLSEGLLAPALRCDSDWVEPYRAAERRGGDGRVATDQHQLGRRAVLSVAVLTSLLTRR